MTRSASRRAPVGLLVAEAETVLVLVRAPLRLVRGLALPSFAEHSLAL